MKLKKSKEFTKGEKKMIIYYTLSQIFLGVLLITLQIIFFYQMYRIVNNNKNRSNCACSGSDFNMMQNESQKLQ